MTENLHEDELSRQIKRASAQVSAAVGVATRSPSAPVAFRGRVEATTSLGRPRYYMDSEAPWLSQS